jgi:hypothetical protein
MVAYSPARSSSTHHPLRWVALLARWWAGGRSIVATVHVLRGLDATRLLTVIPASLSVLAIGSLVAIVHGIRLRGRPVGWRRLIVGLRGVMIVLSAGRHPAGTIHRRVPLAAATAGVYTGPKEEGQQEQADDDGGKDPAAIPIPTVTVDASAIMNVVAVNTVTFLQQALDLVQDGRHGVDAMWWIKCRC